MYTSKDIAIVILNWNGKNLLEQFLPSVLKFSEDASVYVIDNKSADGSSAFIKSKFEAIKVIELDDNYGYAKGYNLGLAHINHPIVCLLNNDVAVTQNWLAPILDSYNNTDAAIIQPKLLDFKAKEYFEYAGAAGGFIDKLGYPYCRGRIFNSIEKDNGQYNDTFPIFWASGACLFIKKDIIEELNGFDEQFFAHMEEIDLCWRAFNYGYSTLYIGQSKVYHLGGATLNHNNPKKTFLNFRNSLYALVKNAYGNISVLILSRLLLDGIAGLRFIIQFKWLHFAAILKAHFSFYKALPRLLKQRKSLIQRKGYYKRRSIVWSYFVRNKQVY
ncbi:MAG: glycosyltransferase family 2 protein [Winogradskyella sp.]|nr:glycosyltransferase family 2 protein [Winogradskyella sp.]